METLGSIISGSLADQWDIASLPECRWRGPLNQFGRVACNSVKIIKPPEGVPPSVCKLCSLANHAPPELPAAPPAASSAAAQVVDLRCRHRGDEVRQEQCDTCAGRVMIKIFACELHQQCSLVKQLDGVVKCETCSDRRPPS